MLLAHARYMKSGMGEGKSSGMCPIQRCSLRITGGKRITHVSIRKVAKHILRYPRFPSDSIAYYKPKWFSRCHKCRVRVEKESAQSLPGIVTTLPRKVYIAVVKRFCRCLPEEFVSWQDSSSTRVFSNQTGFHFRARRIELRYPGTVQAARIGCTGIDVPPTAYPLRHVRQLDSDGIEYLDGGRNFNPTKPSASLNGIEIHKSTTGDRQPQTELPSGRCSL
jgi:hypothetical protein